MSMINPVLQVEQLGEILGVNMTLDEQQQALLLVDGEHPVSLRFHEGRWRFFAMVCPLTAETRSVDYYQRLLALNLNEYQFGEGGLCLDDDSAVLLYIGGPKQVVYTADDLYDNLDRFVKRVDNLRETLM